MKVETFLKVIEVELVEFRGCHARALVEDIPARVDMLLPPFCMFCMGIVDLESFSFFSLKKLIIPILYL